MLILEAESVKLVWNQWRTLGVAELGSNLLIGLDMEAIDCKRDVGTYHDDKVVVIERRRCQANRGDCQRNLILEASQSR